MPPFLSVWFANCLDRACCVSAGHSEVLELCSFGIALSRVSVVPEKAQESFVLVFRVGVELLEVILME